MSATRNATKTGNVVPQMAPPAKIPMKLPAKPILPPKQPPTFPAQFAPSKSTSMAASALKQPSTAKPLPSGDKKGKEVKNGAAAFVPAVAVVGNAGTAAGPEKIV